MDGFIHVAEGRGLSLHPADRGAVDLEALGLVLDFAPGRRLLRHKPRRLWRFRLASQAILRRRGLRGLELQVWVGHATCLAALRPELLSILQHTYVFCEKLGSTWGVLPPAVRSEIWLFQALCFLAERPLDAPTSPLVHVGDSSDPGYALMYGTLPLPAVRSAMRWKERWRFLEVDPPAPLTHISGTWLEKLGGLSVASPDDDDGGLPPGAAGRGWTVHRLPRLP